MVLCSDESIYAGQADNLEARLAAHNDGRFRGFTFTRRPVRLIFQASLPTRQEAIEAERQIKGWSRAKKLALSAGLGAVGTVVAQATTPEALAMRGLIAAVHGSRASPRTGRDDVPSGETCLNVDLRIYS